MRRIYLDYNATTPLDAKVLEAMLPYLAQHHGNPSSIHAEGRAARAAVDQARDTLAQILGARPHEIIFTSGGTESNNLAILGLALSHQQKGRHLITSTIEHHAVLHVVELLQKKYGFEVSYLPVDTNGKISLQDVESIIRPDTILISLMSANNETGVKQPISEVGKICRERGVLFHTDAVQSFGKELVNVSDWEVDALSITAHKFYGPKGIGALYLHSGLALSPQVLGGAQENQRRAGTENVTGMVGLSMAASIATNSIASEAIRQRKLTEELWQGISSNLSGVVRHGDPHLRLGNTLSISLDEVDGEELLIACDLEGLSLSSGSACMVGSVQASHVLLAMGVLPARARSTLRFSIGKHTTTQDIEETIQRVVQVVHRLRGVFTKLT